MVMTFEPAWDFGPAIGIGIRKAAGVCWNMGFSILVSWYYSSIQDYYLGVMSELKKDLERYGTQRQ